MTVTINGATGIAGVNGTAVIPAVQGGGDTNTGVFYPVADTVAISTGGTERMRVNASGNVGIGTASPSSPLNVVAASSSLAIAINGRSSDNLGAMYLYANDGTTQQATITASATEFRYSSVPAAAVQTFYTNAAERLRIASAGQIGIGGANYGTSGQVLTSGGAAAAPSWATVSATGRLLRAPQILTSGTSYTTPAGCTAIYVEVVGGGGAGAFQTGANNAGGGGAGGYSAKYFTVTASTPYTYAIAAGGATRVSAGEGAAGGNTTFTVGATTISGNGGAGGTRTINLPVSGGTGTNGDINISGQSGSASWLTVAPFAMGPGGNSVFGFGGTSGSSATPFAAGTGYGSGGAGAATGATSSVGQPGLIKIWEYS